MSKSGMLRVEPWLKLLALGLVFSLVGCGGSGDSDGWNEQEEFDPALVIEAWIEGAEPKALLVGDRNSGALRKVATLDDFSLSSDSPRYRLSPEGALVAFAKSVGDGQWSLRIADFSARPEQVTSLVSFPAIASEIPRFSWSPSGNWLLYRQLSDVESLYDYRIVEISTGRNIRVAQQVRDGFEFSWSKDDRWLYVNGRSDSSGRNQLKLWETEAGSSQIVDEQDAISGVTCSESGNYALYVVPVSNDPDMDDKTVVFNRSTGVIDDLQGYDIDQKVWLPDREAVVATFAGMDDVLRVDLLTRETQVVPENAGVIDTSGSISTDGSYMFFYRATEQPVLVDTMSWSPTSVQLPADTVIWRAAWSPENDKIAVTLLSANRDTLHLLDVPSGLLSPIPDASAISSFDGVLWISSGEVVFAATSSSSSAPFPFLLLPESGQVKQLATTRIHQGSTGLKAGSVVSAGSRQSHAWYVSESEQGAIESVVGISLQSEKAVRYERVDGARVRSAYFFDILRPSEVARDGRY